MAPFRKQRSSRTDNSRRIARENHDWYRSIVKNAPEILALLDGEGSILYVNPYVGRVLGYRNDELTGHNIFEFVHPDDASRAALEYTDTVQHEGERIPSVLRLRDSSGQWIPFEIVASNRLQDPETRAVVFTARDLRFRKEIEAAILRSNADVEAETAKRTTELAKINAALRIENQARLQAENRLQHTVSLLNATLDSTADGILVVSNEGKVTSCNKKFIEMWRLGCDSSIGKQDKAVLERVIDQLQSPNDFLEKVRSLYTDPSATSFDVVYFKDGRIFERYSQPQRIDEKIMGRVWSFRDVTRARNLELELRQSQKMEAVGRLAGGVAHDFNNLLMLISGYVTQLMENPSLAEGYGTCEQILATTRRAASLTKQLLAFSRKQPDEATTADLNLILLNLEPLLRRLLSDQIQLEVSAAPDPQPIYVDVSQLEMMIMNLAVNAQDAMPEGGQLSIATTTRGLSSRDDEGNEITREFAILEVRDTGHGMTPEVKARIFEPFFTTKQLGRGTGLGLSTVLGIVERAGGRIDVQSEPNRGATFRIFLPKIKATPAEHAPPSASAPGGGTETILLAEDESGIRAMTRAYLEALGYRVLEAVDGAEAIRRSMEYAGPIHLVLTDLLMPGMRGDSAVKAIRSHRPEVKAIFMSGYTDQDLAGDPATILNKPFEFPELGRRLRATLDSDSTKANKMAGPNHLDPAAD
jgi:two-component system cell cycle sensor histidine kinase/response regulator CckA